jgi:hypothetical protein
MSENQGGPSKPKNGPGAGKKNAAALSAALRANLQRRKARERALRMNAQEARHDDPAPLSAPDDGAARTDKARWTE